MMRFFYENTQSAFTCSKSTIEALEQGVKYVHILMFAPWSGVSIVNFEHVDANWVVYSFYL